MAGRVLICERCRYDLTLHGDVVVPDTCPRCKASPAAWRSLPDRSTWTPTEGEQRFLKALYISPE